MFCVFMCFVIKHMNTKNTGHMNTCLSHAICVLSNWTMPSVFLVFMSLICQHVFSINTYAMAKKNMFRENTKTPFWHVTCFFGVHMFHRKTHEHFSHMACYFGVHMFFPKTHEHQKNMSHVCTRYNTCHMCFVCSCVLS